MEPPACPPASRPLARYLWGVKDVFVSYIDDFKGGAFKGKVNWSVEIFDIFQILNDSSLLDAEEKRLITAQALKIVKIMAHLQAGTQMSYEDMILRDQNVDWNVSAMVEEDAKKYGVDWVGQALKVMGLGGAKEGEDFEVRTEGGVTVIVKKAQGSSPGAKLGDGAPEASIKTSDSAGASNVTTAGNSKVEEAAQ